MARRGFWLMLAMMAFLCGVCGCSGGGATPSPVPPVTHTPAPTPTDPPIVGVAHDSGDPLEVATVEYTQRQGGKTFYSNNPEQLTLQDMAHKVRLPGTSDEVGGVVMVQETHMDGRWNAIFEHSNHTGEYVYIGLRLTNEGNTDAKITVHRVGYQTTGDWCGTMAYADYYQQNFPLPADYYDENGVVNWYYELNGLVTYSYRPFTETTYTLPPNTHMYVVGGTSIDAYQNYNVGGTANQPVRSVQAVNGVADFTIEGGDVTGAMMMYTDPKLVGETTVQGYTVREDDLDGHVYPHAEQYGGISDGLAVVETHLTWRVGDETKGQMLPVAYVSEYAKAKNRTNEPYTEYAKDVQTVERSVDWTTNLNPQNYPGAVGSDIIGFRCVDTNGVERVIDRFHTDGAGNGANICNWMVAMRDTYTLENASDHDRVLRLYARSSGRGIASVLVRDAADRVLKTYQLTIPFMLDNINQVPEEYRERYVFGGDVWIPIIDGRRYSITNERALAYEITVPALQAVTVTVEYVMLANSWGSVTHFVEISD